MIGKRAFRNERLSAWKPRKEKRGKHPKKKNPPDGGKSDSVPPNSSVSSPNFHFFIPEKERRERFPSTLFNFDSIIEIIFAEILDSGKGKKKKISLCLKNYYTYFFSHDDKMVNKWRYSSTGNTAIGIGRGTRVALRSNSLVTRNGANQFRRESETMLSVSFPVNQEANHDA